MKTTTKRHLTLALLLAVPMFIAGCGDHSDHDHADHDHDHADHDHGAEDVHDENVTAGPNGGLLVKSQAGFAFEVLADKQRMAHFTLVDENGKAAAAGEATVEGIAGERSSPVKLTFVKSEDGKLISDKALPDGAHVPMVLTIKLSPEAEAVTERFELHLH